MPRPRVNSDETNLEHVDPPTRRQHLRSKGALAWHIRKAPKGPKSLAIKNHFIAMIGEYVGTVLFMIFALGGTNVALIPATSLTGGVTAGQDNSAVSTVNTSNLLYIALSFGFSLAVNAWTFFRVSGGLFNPAVSLGMVLVGALTPLRGALLTVSQILGGITGAAIIQALTPGTLNVRTTLGGGTSVVQGLFIEMFLTALLMLAILLLAAEKHKATFIAPIGIGLALFVAELLGVYYTGGSLNPARSFGPSVVLHTFENYHWIYWLGPILGASLAAGFYKLLKWLQYETVLGPEDGETAPAAGSAGIIDVEKTAGTGAATNTSGLMDVSGPGLGDLHTHGNAEAVFDLRDASTTVDYQVRLDRIEGMLAQLIESRSSPATRRSDLTYIESGNGSGGNHKYANVSGHDHDHDVDAPIVAGGKQPVAHMHVNQPNQPIHPGSGLNPTQQFEAEQARRY